MTNEEIQASAERERAFVAEWRGLSKPDRENTRLSEWLRVKMDLPPDHWYLASVNAGLCKAQPTEVQP